MMAQKNIQDRSPAALSEDRRETSRRCRGPARLSRAGSIIFRALAIDIYGERFDGCGIELVPPGRANAARPVVDDVVDGLPVAAIEPQIVAQIRAAVRLEA